MGQCNRCLKSKTKQKTDQRGRFREAGLCIDCGGYEVSNLNKLYCERYRTRRANTLRRTVVRLKSITINIYGGECKCCGEKNIKFLTIDHIDGGGNKHRALISSNRSGASFYRWLKKNNYPAGFQVLCWNCNCGRAFNNGICPHVENTKL